MKRLYVSTWKADLMSWQLLGKRQNIERQQFRLTTIGHAWQSVNKNKDEFRQELAGSQAEMRRHREDLEMWIPTEKGNCLQPQTVHQRILQRF